MESDRSRLFSISVNFQNQFISQKVCACQSVICCWHLAQFICIQGSWGSQGLANTKQFSLNFSMDFVLELSNPSDVWNPLIQLKGEKYQKISRWKRNLRRQKIVRKSKWMRNTGRIQFVQEYTFSICTMKVASDPSQSFPICPFLNTIIVCYLSE